MEILKSLLKPIFTTVGFMLKILDPPCNCRVRNGLFACENQRWERKFTVQNVRPYKREIIRMAAKVWNQEVTSVRRK